MKRKRKSLGREACPVVTFRRRSPPKGSSIRGAFIEAIADRQSVGHAIVVKEDGAPYVSDIRVSAELQRCGLGTRLYEQAAQYACDALAEPLHSDITRSVMSDRFWQKQVTKGRAVCVRAARYSVPPVPDWMPTEGRSGCVRYRLTCPAPTDLSKRKRARR